MSTVSSKGARPAARSAAPAPAAAGFRPTAAAIAIAAAFALQPLVVQAQPMGGKPVHGGFTTTRSGSNLLVTTTNGAGTNHSVINWTSFSVPAGSVTEFKQPVGSTSINKVIAPNPSSIFGTLKSNGNLVLVNPSGITVGSGGVVDTAGFTASTLDMSDSDAIAGTMYFTAGNQPLQVDGKILARAGDIVLIGPRVQTGSGAVVEAQADGSTLLVAGQTVGITGRGLENISLVVSSGGQALNLGTLRGDAVGIFAGTMQHSGLIQAKAVTTTGGKVVLHAEDGGVTGTGIIEAPQLYAYASNNGSPLPEAGKVRLTGANRVGVLSGQVNGSGSEFTFTNAQQLTIGEVATIWSGGAGVQGNDGINPAPIQLRTTAGGIDVQPLANVFGSTVTLETAAGGDIRVQGATVEAVDGAITLNSGRNILGQGAFFTWGSPTADGLGGAVNVEAPGGSVSFGSISTQGWVTPTRPHGGKVTIHAGGTVSGGRIATHGGYSQGGNGGEVRVGAGTGIAIDDITAYGDYQAGGSGGLAGAVTLDSAGGDIAVAHVDVGGGSGASGQKGGTLTVSAQAGNVKLGDVYGVGGYAEGAGAAGAGSDVRVMASGDILLAPYGYGIYARGGDSDTGRGGQGGRVELKAGGSVLMAPPTGGTTAVAGTSESISGYGFIAAGGGWGGTPGRGGSVLVDAGAALELGTIEVLGGSAADGSGAAGGQGGDVHLRFGGSIGNTSVWATGGDGGYAPQGGTGGTGGSIKLERVGGAMVLDGTVMLMASGGYGGNADATAANGTGGAGGNGGSIELLAGGGAVHLRSPGVMAEGGQGGNAADGSTQAASGGMGAFSAMGTSVEVESHFGLFAVWTNSSNVHVRGASVVYGTGTFRNLSDLSLYDTAWIEAAGGIDNQGNLRSFGQNSASLQQNAGLVEVVAASTLWTPGFVSNEGLLKVDGRLDIGPSPASCSLCTLQATLSPSTGPTFTNAAGGMIAGSGTLAVDGGGGTVHNFGSIAPGGVGAIGTFTIEGSLAMQSGSTLKTDLLSATSHDVLKVAGTASTGGTVAVAYQAGASFASGTRFQVLQAGTLAATTLPTANVTELTPTAGTGELLLVANSGYPASAPPPSPPPPAVTPQEPAVQQVVSQVVSFADQFVQQVEQQQSDEASENAVGKDDITITETACTAQ